MLKLIHRKVVWICLNYGKGFTMYSRLQLLFPLYRFRIILGQIFILLAFFSIVGPMMPSNPMEADFNSSKERRICSKRLPPPYCGCLDLTNTAQIFMQPTGGFIFDSIYNSRQAKEVSSEKIPVFYYIDKCDFFDL